MTTRLPATKTPTDAKSLYAALLAAWLGLWPDSPPTRAPLLLLVAQWGLETGFGKQCMCWNLGNVKAKAGGAVDWQYYECGEILPSAQARLLVTQDSRAEILADNGVSASVRFLPDHPACCFAAFESLEDGARFWLEEHHNGFSSAWPALLSGDPRAFAAALKAARYYTAPEDRYATTLSACLSMAAREIPEIPETPA